MVYVRNPYITAEERQQYFLGVLYHGVIDLRYRTELYEEINKHTQEILMSSKTPSELDKINKVYTKIVDNYLRGRRLRKVTIYIIHLEEK